MGLQYLQEPTLVSKVYLNHYLSCIVFPFIRSVILCVIFIHRKLYPVKISTNIGVSTICSRLRTQIYIHERSNWYRYIHLNDFYKCCNAILSGVDMYTAGSLYRKTWLKSSSITCKNRSRVSLIRLYVDMDVEVVSIVEVTIYSLIHLYTLIIAWMVSTKSFACMRLLTSIVEWYLPKGKIQIGIYIYGDMHMGCMFLRVYTQRCSHMAGRQ